MTIKKIEDEIAQFNDKYFSSYFELVNINMDFIEAHDLYRPKSNYLLTYEFVTATIRHFTNLDFRFMSATFEKLNRDVSILYKQYERLKEHEKNVADIFDKSFVKRSPLLQEIYDAILDLQKGSKLDAYEQETKEILNTHFNELKEIYHDYFIEDFLFLNREFILSVEMILNTKIYYLDRLLWIHTKESPIIMHALKVAKMGDNMSSKRYLEYRLSVSLPYSDNYRYLQKCVRIYK